MRHKSANGRGGDNGGAKRSHRGGYPTDDRARVNGDQCALADRGSAFAHSDYAADPNNHPHSRANQGSRA